MPHNIPAAIAYVNARLLDPASGLDRMGSLVTKGEVIHDVGPDIAIPANAEVIDCEGQCLAPGLLDMRVQLREPGEEHKETIKSAGEAAVSGGVTAMVCLPNTNPVIDDVATVEFVARRARLTALAKVWPYAAATKGLQGRELAEMGMLAEAGAVAVTDGLQPIADARTMLRALSYAATFDLLLVQHAEEPSLARGVMNSGEMSTRLGLSGIPAVAEVMMIERDLRLVEMTRARYHVAHVSTAEGVAAIRRAKERGLPVTCDTAPPYFALNELAIGDYRTFAKLSPPLRSETDRRAVVEGLRDGTIDAIASDHAPQDADSKRLPFAIAETGGVGLETLLPITMELYHNEHLSLLGALALLTNRPADLLKLPVGRLAKDRPADLLLFDPDRAWKVRADNFRSKSKNSPFDGRPVQGVVLRTVVDGRMVYSRND